MTIKISTSLLAGETLISYAPEAFLWADQPAVELLLSSHWILWGESLRAEKPTDEGIGAAPFLAQAFTRARAMGLAGRWTWRDGIISRELLSIEADAKQGGEAVSALVPPAGEYVSLDVERPESINLVEAGVPAVFRGKGPTESWDQRELTQSSRTLEASVRLQLRYAVALANAGALLFAKTDDAKAPVIIARSNGADGLAVCGIVMPMGDK